MRLIRASCRTEGRAMSLVTFRDLAVRFSLKRRVIDAVEGATR